ncbi:MAG: DUF5670 family protein [Pseudonocardiaceae bacterium]
MNSELGQCPQSEARESETYMLWLTGSLLLVIWIIAKFLLHKSGMVHLFLMAAVIVFVVQFTQDWRTREYRRSQDS